MFTDIATIIFMFLLCAVDIWSYFFLELHSCYFLLAFLIAYYWYHDSSFMMSAGILLLVTESCITYPSPSFAFLIIFPLLAIIRTLKHRMYLTLLQPVVTLGVAIIADITMSNQFLKNSSFASSYTTSILFGNLLVITFFSLKLSGGKTKQSLMSLT